MPLEGKEALFQAWAEAQNIPGANMAEPRGQGRADTKKLDCGGSLNLVKNPGLPQNVKMKLLWGFRQQNDTLQFTFRKDDSTMEISCNNQALQLQISDSKLFLKPLNVPTITPILFSF